MSQTNEIYNILSDGLPHRSDQIQEKMFGSTKVGLFRLAARVNDLKQLGYAIKGWKDDKVKTLYWYQLIGSENAGFEQPEPKFIGKTSAGSNYCCYSMFKFKTHDPNCLKTKVQTLL